MMLMSEETGGGRCWVQIRIAGILPLGIPAEEAKVRSLSDADWGKVRRAPKTYWNSPQALFYI